MKDQYRRARRITGSTFYTNLWLVEDNAHSISVVAIEDAHVTPADVDLASVARDSGFHVPAYALRQVKARGDAWSGWGMYCTDGSFDPLEHVTRAEVIGYLVDQFPGAELSS